MRALLLPSFMLLAACGQAGDLYLPPEQPPAPAPAQQPAPPAADAPAPPEDKNKDKK